VIVDRDSARELLRKALDNPGAEFRPRQWEAIDAVINHRKKLLVVERTGWGKSIVYFIGTSALRSRGAGPTLIVSPLLALMRNQLEAAGGLSLRAETINSSNRDEWNRVVERIRGDKVDALLISPERLSNSSFVDEVLLPLAGRIGLLVVDEAHCISDWGHDFRPDYRRIVNVLRQMPPNMPVLGTTATANNRVIKDVKSQLGDIEVQRGPLIRESLQLQTIELPDQPARLVWLAHNVPKLPGTGIIYVLTKRDARKVSEWLNQNGISAKPYYSGIKHSDFEDSNSYRLHLEGLLKRNELKALVATVALGMGYDKPDLGFVVHFQAPSSVVAYYQQVGRAGRAIERAFGILLMGREDSDIHAFFRRTAFPDEDHVQHILEVLEKHEGISLFELQKHLNLTHGQIEKVLKYLSVDSPAPVVKVGNEWVRTPVSYELDRDRIQRLTSQREEEWGEVKSYVAATECLMSYLCRHLDDPTHAPCGKCANCLEGPLLEDDVPRALGIGAAQFLRCAEIPLRPKIQVAPGAFQVYGFQSLSRELRAQEGRILSNWGDAGWGRVVSEDKHSNHFRDDLVEAVAEMITKRWNPEPAPQWLTCVPSHNHPDLVPDFAKRLARRIGIPFIEAIDKVRNNEPQKLQQNRYHQCRNLDGVFKVRSRVPPAAVFLVDDIVDSGWTMAVLSALLRQEGSGGVFPVALASTKPGD